MNYWGEPNDVGGTCERCDCNGNIDMSVSNLWIAIGIE